MTAPFELRGVSTGPPDEPVLRSLSVDVPCRGITVVAGPSGAGKSSLLRLLNRLDDPREGSVAWEGRPLTDHEPTGLRRRVAMVFQRPAVFPGTVADNLAVAVPGIDRPGAAAALVGVGLDPELVDRSAADLSGGEAQRMCLARALLTSPSVVLADEPTASLDGASRDVVEELARRLADGGLPFVWVSHDVGQLRRLADHVVVLVDGGVAAAGELADLDGHADRRIRDLVGAP